jgi:hypothetical protein
MDQENLSPQDIARQAIERCRREIAAAWGHLDTAKESLRRAPPLPALTGVDDEADDDSDASGAGVSVRVPERRRRRRAGRRHRWQRPVVLLLPRERRRRN